MENGTPPDKLIVKVNGKTTRPLCPHPSVAVYKGTGSTHDAANFECGENTPVGKDAEDCDARVNQRLFEGRLCRRSRAPMLRGRACV